MPTNWSDFEPVAPVQKTASTKVDWSQFEPATPAKADGQMASGFKRSFEEVPGLAAGVAAYGADVLGATETRDALIQYAQRKNDELAASHANDAQSITDTWDGKTGWLDFLANSAGYVAGQALQSIATGGLGAVGARMLAKQGARELAEGVAAREIAAGASEQAAQAAVAKALAESATKTATRGAIAGAGAHNFGMELGSIYPDAVGEAGGADNLDGGDKFRILAAASLAAGVDTAGEAIMASRFLKGSKAGAPKVGPDGVISEGPGLLGRAAREIPAGMAREAGTEGIQTGLEQYGAGKTIGDAASIKDIVDSMGVGAVGGALGGAAGARKARPVEQAEHAPVAGILEATDINAAIEATRRAIEEPNAREKRAALADEILQLPQELQAEAKGLLATTGNWVPSPHVRAFAQSRLDEMLAPLRTIPVGEVIEDPAGTIPVPDTQELTSSEATSQILQPPDPAQIRAVGTRIPTGRATEIAPESIELGNQLPVGDVIEAGGDVPRPDGMPERRNTDGLALDFGTPQHFNAPHSVFQYVQTIAGLGTPASRAFVQDYKAGRITNDDVLNLLVPTRREPTANQRIEAAAAQAPKTEALKPGDLLTSDGKPYGVRVAAAVRAKKEGGTVVEVQGGWAVRPKESQGAQPDLPVPAPVAVRATDGAGDQPGGSGGTVRPVADAGRAGQVYPGVPEAAASGIADRPAAGPGSERDPALSDDLPTLKAAWSDAVARGDSAEAKRINDRIVQAKQAPAVNPAPGAGFQSEPLKYGRDTMRKSTDEPWQEKFYTERTDNGRVRLVSYKNFNGLGAFDTEEQAAQEARSLAQPAQGTHDQRRAFLDTLSDDALRNLVKKLGQPTYGKGVEPIVARRLHEGFALSFPMDRLQDVAGVATAAPASLPGKIKAKRAAKQEAAPKKTFAEMAQEAKDSVPGYLGKNADGEIVYEDKRGVRSILRDGVRITEPVAMRPTRDGMRLSVEHRGEYLTVEESAPNAEPSAVPATVAESAPVAANDPTLDDELNAALGRLGDVLGDVFGTKLNITGPQYSAGDLLPALSKVVELLVRKGFKSFGQAAGKAAQLMRANPKTAPHVDAISPRQWKAAYNAIAEGTDGTDTEEALAALTVDQVKAIVAAPEAEAAPTLADKIKAKRQEAASEAEQEAAPEGLVVVPADAADFAAALNQSYGDDQRLQATFHPDITPVSNPRVTSKTPKPAGVEFITPDQAADKLAEWKAEAARQNKALAGPNGNRVVLSLFDASGVLAQPWHEAGYRVFTYDLQTGGDIAAFNAENLLETHGNDEIFAILAQPPCTDFASSGAQWWKSKDEDGRTEASNELVRQVLRTVELFRPPVWVMENPVGRIAELNKLPTPLLSMDPWNYGDPYSKRTLLWGKFDPNLPTAMVEPTEGSKIHRMSSSAKYERSLTSEPFAYALFMANNADALGPVGRLAAEYAGVDRQLLQGAVDAGLSEYKIKSLIDDAYSDSDLETVEEELRSVGAKPAEAKAPATTPSRNDALVELRKQLSVLKALRACLG